MSGILCLAFSTPLYIILTGPFFTKDKKNITSAETICNHVYYLYDNESGSNQQPVPILPNRRRNKNLTDRGIKT
jgi:hypothetical protein